MEPQSALGHYQSIEKVTICMLAAARRSDWDEFLRNEAKCTQLIEALRRTPDLVPLADDEKSQKTKLIRQMLATDAEIRDLLSPWLARIAALLQTGVAGKKATQAYRSSND